MLLLLLLFSLHGIEPWLRNCVEGAGRRPKLVGSREMLGHETKKRCEVLEGNEGNMSR